MGSRSGALRLMALLVVALLVVTLLAMDLLTITLLVVALLTVALLAVALLAVALRLLAILIVRHGAVLWWSTRVRVWAHRRAHHALDKLISLHLRRQWLRVQ